MTRRVRTPSAQLDQDFAALRKILAPVFTDQILNLRSITRHLSMSGKLSSVVIKGTDGQGMKISVKVQIG